MTDVQIPNIIQEALQSPEWRTAVEEEIQALEKNKTWEITYLPKGKGQLDANGYSQSNTRKMGA